MQLQQLAEFYVPVTALANGYRITANNSLDFTPSFWALIDCHDTKRNTACAAKLIPRYVAGGLASWAKKPPADIIFLNWH